MPTALLSVYDKSGIIELAQALHELGWKVVSSGGTARAISASGTPVTDLAELTGVPAILDHRVVTLHPKIHGGLLADPTKPQHRVDMSRHGIEAIDLLVCNLYPFASDPSIEMIDIGGPAMVRAAAKNHKFVAVVVDPADYGAVLDELRTDGSLGATTKRRLAAHAFSRIAAYDAQIASWFDDANLPEAMHLSMTKAQSLRYGENPHQSGARYRIEGRRSWWDEVVQHGGKEMSYLNLYDTEAAWRLVQRLDKPACVIVKHANPCGVAVGANVTDSYVKANACDPVSAFGGVVALNSAVPAGLAEALAAVFTEVIVAPSMDDDALSILTEKKNLRVLTGPPPYGAPLDVRSIDGGLLVQDVDTVSVDRSKWRVVTSAEPSDGQWADLEFAWTVCAAVSSNAIVYARDMQAFGIGAGQQNRLDSARIAADRS
ncbi:MAG TPA: bifunctional phosphoribosylaminoimidazolecarboxamide formyltransferase/IMP cyclohydrolase, partial [Ilumatobacteraceae bacterium]|nr:bifunctional phosphoribosylaminoimidazolecarboxamide formyltransferase/IMP cyclohydrolase [Ilumatobacteraceae bacterium]